MEINYLELIIQIIVFLYSVIFHEIAHGLVAYRYGDDTARIAGRLSLNPLVHIDPIGSIFVPLLLKLSGSGFLFGWAKPVPVNPYRLKDAKKAYRWVALAGVLTNLLLAVIAATILKITIQYLGLGLFNAGVLFFVYALQINIILGVFNSLPLPGFDGFNFLTTFEWFSRLISRSPLGNPLFMVQYGLFISIFILLLIWPLISNIIYFFLRVFGLIFGL